MGGLVLRAAAAVADECDDRWVDRVTDVVTLGTPHLGSPVASGVGRRQPGAGAGCPSPRRSAGSSTGARSGVHDLVHGLTEDVPPLPHARYRLVAATLTRSPRHPVGAVLGDCLVRVPSAFGRGGSVELFPGADVLHVGGTDHFDLLNHPACTTHCATGSPERTSSSPAAESAVGEQGWLSRGSVRASG